MGKEIERKFLLKSDTFDELLKDGVNIVQGYLNSAKERTVRVRIYGDKAFLTVKGQSDETGTTRFEFEKKISMEDAKELLELCEPGVIEKTRTRIPVGKHTFEVDQFIGRNKGLIIAEIELKTEDEIFERPDWLGNEVTGDPRYYNSQLSQNPFTKW